MHRPEEGHGNLVSSMLVQIIQSIMRQIALPLLPVSEDESWRWLQAKHPGNRFKTAADRASLFLTLFWTGALPFRSLISFRSTPLEQQVLKFTVVLFLFEQSSALFQIMTDTHIYNDQEREIHGRKSGQSLQRCLVYLGVQGQGV